MNEWMNEWMDDMNQLAQVNDSWMTGQWSVFGKNVQMFVARILFQVIPEYELHELLGDCGKEMNWIHEWRKH